mmetsp:Transcript_5925/g.16664  ORF Transcript_5925/g.16664 Transcript_5925/m.16664 type:complete len:438 (-) Transcript_5925:2389-3702(-)
MSGKRHTYPDAQQQCDALWLVLKESSRRLAGQRPCQTSATTGESNTKTARNFPSYDTVVSDITQSDYSENLRCPHDLRFLSGGDGCKTLCPHGVICKAKIEMFDQPSSIPHQGGSPQPYTGLLKPGHTVEHCIVRLSSAMRPPNDVVKNPVAQAVLRAAGSKLRKAKLFPCAAIKCFRGDNKNSANALFSGCKVGQSETDYFAHCQCTQLSERMSPALKPLVRPFWKYSDHPLSLGISDYCAFDVDGKPPEEGGIQFPYVLILNPVMKMGGDTSTNASLERLNSAFATGTSLDPSQHSTESTSKGSRGKKKKEKSIRNSEPFDKFLDDLEKIEPGTTLFDLFACPDPLSVPDPTRLIRIGRIVTVSEMLPSPPNDNLFFRHQRKEDDFQLRPGWKKDTKTKCSVGKDRGTIAKLAGWELFEEHIQTKKYVDFEAQCS